MICNKCFIEKGNNFYVGKKICKDCVSLYNKNLRKGVSLRGPKKLTSYAGYDWLEVDINKYEDYFEEGFQERMQKWFEKEILKK